MTPAPTRVDLERLIAQLENWDADGESGRLLLEAAVMLRALSPSVALEPPPEPGTWQCRKCGYNRTVGPTWACPTIGICEPAISPLAEPLRINERPVAWLHANHSTAYVITNRVKNIWLDCDPKHVEHYTIPLYAGNK